MYYKITDTLVELAEGKNGIESSARAKEVLTFLNITIKLGKHFVYGRINLLERVLTVDSTLTSFNSIISSYSELGAIAKNFEWHAEFVGDKQSKKEESTHTIYISISDCAKFEVYKETLFLCEHINDAFFFNYITEYYKKQIGFENITTKSSFLLGGGCSTAKVYEYEIDRESSFIVCVTDSDYRFSNSKGTAKLGDTAKSVESIDRKKRAFFSTFYHLENVSEVENLIPFDLLLRYFSIPGNDTNGIEEIKIIASKDRRFLSFLDYKKGVSLKRITEAHKDDNILDIVKLVVPNIDALILKETKKVEEELKKTGFQLGSKQYNEYKKSFSKESKYIHGLGDSILDSILSIIDKDNFSISTFPETLFDFFDKAEEEQKKEYEIIGRLLLNWTCALPQVLC